MMPAFVDALDLAGRDFTRRRVIVFCGESGAGKSSAIRFLIAAHPAIAADPERIVIEELRDWRDLGVFLRALMQRRRLLVASHLPVWLHRVLGVLAPTAVIPLDAYPEKISRWLDARGVPYSSEAVAAFCARFGANYTDAALILDHRPGASFDAALGWFLQRCRIERGAIGRHEPVHVLAAGDVDAHYRALP
jgi:hypothetical protein